MGVEMGMEMKSPHIPEDNWLDPWLMQVYVEQVEGGQTGITGMLTGPPFLPAESCSSKAGMLRPCLKAQAGGQKVTLGPACKE